jgi:hypothetical protein
MESIKKTYKPKEDKVAKLTKAYNEIKSVKPIKCELFTKTAKIIGFLVLLSSCSADYHLKQACKKDSTICNQKTIVFDTLIYTDSIEIYEVFETQVHDTITIDTGSVKVTIIRDHDIIRTYVKQRPDTVRITKTYNVPQYIQKENKINWWIIGGIVIFLIWLIKKL